VQRLVAELGEPVELGLGRFVRGSHGEGD
jgi:hypothetical protein